MSLRLDASYLKKKTNKKKKQKKKKKKKTSNFGSHDGNKVPIIAMNHILFWHENYEFAKQALHLW